MVELCKIVGENNNDPTGMTPARVDERAEALVTIDTVHERIHRGQLFSVDYLDAALASAGVIEMLVTVPSGVAAHSRITGSAGGDATLKIFESPTVSASGTALTPVDRNRSTANTATLTVTHTPTTTADGTQLMDMLLPGGAGGNAAGSSDDIFGEMILAAGKTYLIRLTNIAGTTKPAHLQLDFYEQA